MRKEFLSEIGKRIRILRLDMGYTQKELAAACAKAGASISDAGISAIEKGARAPSVPVLVAMADTLQASTDYITLRTDDARWIKENDIAISPDSDEQRRLIEDLIDLILDRPVEEARPLYESMRLLASTKVRIIGSE